MTIIKTLEPMVLEITLNDPKAIDIVESFPVDRRDSIIEKYIILGDMVVTHASISTSKESVENFFSPLRQDIETIREQLKQIVPTVATPAKKGEITVESIFKSYQDHFMDDAFEDVSRIGKYSDILATTSSTNTPVLIEVKEYSDTVPFSQVEKFWRDMELRDTKYGIFISMRSRISKCSGCINMKHNLDRTGVFVVNSELNWFGHVFAFYIVKKLIELEALKAKELPDAKYRIEDISEVITKINANIMEIQKLGDFLDRINITADKLKNKCIDDLDEIQSIVRLYKNKMKDQIDNTIEELERVSV